jgi:hypothetical protein
MPATPIHARQVKQNKTNNDNLIFRWLIFQQLILDMMIDDRPIY